MTPPHHFEYFNPRRQDPDRDACLAVFKRILIFFAWLAATQNNPMARLLGNLAVCILPFLNATNQLITHEQALGYALPGEFQPSPSSPPEIDVDLPNGSPPPGYQENAQPDHHSDLEEYYDYHGSDNDNTDSLPSSSDGTMPDLEDIHSPSPSRLINSPFEPSQNRSVAVVQPLGQQVRAPARAARRRDPTIQREGIPVPPPSPEMARVRRQPPAISFFYNRCYACAAIGHTWRCCNDARARANFMANPHPAPAPVPFNADTPERRRQREMQPLLNQRGAPNPRAPGRRGRGAYNQQAPGRHGYAPRGRGANRGPQRGAQRGAQRGRHVFPIFR